MKRTLSVVIALLLAFSLFACKSNDSQETSSPPPSGETNTPDSPAPGTVAPDTPATPTEPVNNEATGEIGMYDPNYDYTANQRYKVIYLVSNNTSGLYTESGKSFEHWASLSNVDYQGLLDMGGDVDAFFSQLPQLANDYDGIIMDADATTYDRVYEIMEAAGTPWMSFMAAPRDYTMGETTPLLHPYIGFEQYDVGAYHAEYLYNKAKATWPDVPMSEFGFITVDYSPAPPLHEREMGAYDTLIALDPDMAANRYFVADTSTVGTFTADNSQQVVNTVLSMHPEISRWLVFAEIDDMAIGAAAALDLMGYTDDSWVTAFGGTALQQQWDTGRQSAWKSANFLPQVIFTEPIYFTLYAFMNGDATPETIFPEWKNVHEDTTYGSFASRLLPYYEILFDNYRHVLKWSDVYANSNIYPNYPSEGITRDSYSNTVQIPAEYK